MERRPRARRRSLRLQPLERREVLSVGPLITDFAGPGQTNLRPPDPIASAGLDTVLAMINSEIALYSKSGTLIERAHLDAPLGPNTGFFEEVDHDFGSFDPWTVWDPYAERTIAMAEEVEFGTVNPDGSGGPRRGGYGADEANLMIALSTSSAPNDLDTAPGDADDDWMTFSIPAVHNFGTGLAWIDYPKVAADADSLYITGNYFTFGARQYVGTLITRLDKLALLSGSLGSRVDVQASAPLATLQPAQSYGRPASAPQLFVSATLNGLDVFEMDDNNALLARNLPFSYLEYTGGAPQLGGPDRLDTLSARLMNAVWREGSIWTTHTVSVNGEAAVRWYEIEEGALHQYAIAQTGVVDPGPGAHAFMPSIAVDADGNMGLTYTQSSATQFAAMMYTGRRATDPAGYTSPGRVVRAGDAYYAPDANASVERWGDYSGLALDPADSATFWAFGEYPVAANAWGTWWGAFQVPEAGVDVTPTTGLVTTESGGSVALQMRLTAAPTADVTVNVFLSDATEAETTPTTLHFTPANWDHYQPLTVTGRDDILEDGDVAYSIALSTQSTDVNYAAAPPRILALVNEDDDPDDAPRVLGVAISSFGTVHDEYVVPSGSGEQLRTVAAGMVDLIRLSFDQPVDVEAGDLAINGVRQPSYAVADFSYEPATYSAVWRLTEQIQADRLTLVLGDQVQDATGFELDGEWEGPTSLADPSSSAFPSGNGAEGGVFTFVVTVLSGDGNRDNLVTGADFTLWANHFFDPPGSVTFGEGDYNGDGRATGGDFTLWANTFFVVFPAPIAPPPAGGTTLGRADLAPLQSQTAKVERLAPPSATPRKELLADARGSARVRPRAPLGSEPAGGELS